MRHHIYLMTMLLCLCGLAANASAESLATLHALGPVSNNSMENSHQAQAPPVQHRALALIEQRVNVVINNGFASVEVFHTFANKNSSSIEAMYRIPLPEKALLSELSIIRGEVTQEGEVIAKDKARKIYEQEKQAGNDAALAEKNSYKWHEFRITPVAAHSEITMRHRYYQPLVIDHGIGKFLFPREAGGTEDAGAQSFWQGNVSENNSKFQFNCEVRSAVPLAEVRVPGFPTANTHKTQTADENTEQQDTWKIKLNENQSAGKDVVVYYRLQDNAPGRVEMLTYKPEADKPGYFMMILTPGLDLQPILQGTDYTFVLDVSGSMRGKLGTLASGVQKALGRLRDIDRFRIIKFSNSAQVVIPFTPATLQNVQAACQTVGGLGVEGGTNMYAGMQAGFSKIDADRPAAVILVTDGVTNTGVTSPKEFYKLSSKYDVRLFSFLMGNSSNWPLLDVISKASGGFYTAVSNQDDIIGQILMAKDRMCRESLHHAQLKIKGVRCFDTTDGAFKKIYHGQQLIIFGRYDKGGQADIELKAKLSGADKNYQTQIAFPDISNDFPELERLWAMNRIEDLYRQTMIGKTKEEEATTAERDLGVAYQIVTDETSMLVLSDEAFVRHGIDRQNKQRIAKERVVQQQRQQQPTRSYRVDNKKPMFQRPANKVTRPSSGSGSG
ncbi:MAG: VWA domain-containing protein, partial [Planctomycetes bacterium]|nr:VWA domain-containing protein [Planctomycetota bacterium]